MKSHVCLSIAVAAWTAALVLVVIGSFRPQIADVLSMWAQFVLAVGATATVSLVISRAQYDVVEDMTSHLHRIRRDSRLGAVRDD